QRAHRPQNVHVPLLLDQPTDRNEAAYGVRGRREAVVGESLRDPHHDALPGWAATPDDDLAHRLRENGHPREPAPGGAIAFDPGGIPQEPGGVMAVEGDDERNPQLFGQRKE